MQRCLHFNKGQYKFDSGHIANGVLYQYYCSYCMKETQKKYDHPVSRCLSVKIGPPKNDVVKPKQTEQRV